MKRLLTDDGPKKDAKPRKRWMQTPEQKRIWIIATKKDAPANMCGNGPELHKDPYMHYTCIPLEHSPPPPPPPPLSFCCKLLYVMTLILISMSLVVSTVCAFGLAKAFDKLTGVKIPCQLLFIFLVLFPAPGAAATQGLADQSSIQVHTNINASMVAVDDVASWAQLVTACATPSANITLSPTFQMGAYNNEIDFSGKVITIFGSNATLDAGQKGRFFNGDGSKGKTSLELHSITLKNGYARDFGGAIFIQDGTLVIHDSTFATNGKIDGENMTDYGMGGAISANGPIPSRWPRATADVKIYTCVFESNTAYHRPKLRFILQSSRTIELRRAVVGPSQLDLMIQLLDYSSMIQPLIPILLALMGVLFTPMEQMCYFITARLQATWLIPIWMVAVQYGSAMLMRISLAASSTATMIPRATTTSPAIWFNTSPRRM
jgi:hypothetical protein